MGSNRTLPPPQSRISPVICQSQRDSPREPKFKWSVRRRCQDHVTPKPNKRFCHVLSAPLRFTHHWGSAWQPGGADNTRRHARLSFWWSAAAGHGEHRGGSTQLVSATWLVRRDKEKIWIRRWRADVEISILMFIHVYVPELTQSLLRSLIL